VHGAQLMVFLDLTKKVHEEYIIVEKQDKTQERVSNLEYIAWLTQDQHLLSYLNSTLTKEVLGKVTICDMAAQV
jgi:hypothetical protein